MRFKIIPFVMLIAPTSFAETENFNMTLTGDVAKDYCTINTPITNFNFGSIDATNLDNLNRTRAAEMVIGQNSYILPFEQTMSITCADGTNYDVYPDIPESGYLIGSSTVIGFDVSEDPFTNFLSVVNTSNPIEIIATGEEQLLDVTMWFTSLTGNLNDMEDSINVVIPWVIRTK